MPRPFFEIRNREVSVRDVQIFLLQHDEVVLEVDVVEPVVKETDEEVSTDLKDADVEKPQRTARV